MTVVALVSASADLSFLAPMFEAADSSLEPAVWPDPRCADAQVALCWEPPPHVYEAMPALRLIHSLAAGVDSVVAAQNVEGLPVCRVVDPGQADGMLEYVRWSVLWFQRRFDEAAANALQELWQRPAPLAAKDCSVGIMGLGKLGGRVAAELAESGYAVRGWARTHRSVPGVDCFSADAGLSKFLAETNMLVCLLPLTSGTAGILDRELFERLPAGAALVQCGRGQQLVEADLLAALDAGHLRGAVVDVFASEPLPPGHAFWRHPKIVVTPHMATIPSFPVVVDQVVANIRRLRDGSPLQNIVDPALGY